MIKDIPMKESYGKSGGDIGEHGSGGRRQCDGCNKATHRGARIVGMLYRTKNSLCVLSQERRKHER